MSAQNNEVNRNIDSETAEGHRVDRLGLEESEDPGKKMASRKAAELDDETEGHGARF
jgi:hypothetical protein